MRRLFIYSAYASLFFSSSIYAAAFQFYELGTPVIGRAAVGQTLVDDASSSYFNPAAMTLLPSSEYMLGTQIILPYTNFSPNTRNTITGGDGGNAGNLTPGGDFYYVACLTQNWKFGISLTSPYGGYLTYTDGWVGRYNVQQMQLYTLDLNPALAYRFNNWLAFGAGLTVEYANLHQTVALPIIPLVDGQANIKVSNTSLGFNAGILLTPYQATQIGIAYRSQISHNLTGNTTFLRILANPGTNTRIIMPQNVIASIAYDVSYRFTVLGELGWSQWSRMKNTVLNVAGFSATTVLNWHDTYRIGLATKFRITPALLLQAGASYDSSPTTSSKRLPDMPMDRQIRLAGGLIYNVMPPVQLGFSYEYINLGNANINNVSANGVLSGSYSRNYANVLQASINVYV